MKQVLTKAFALLLVCCIATQSGWAFCGFYVAKAGAELFNNKSQVILVRNGNKTTITMANDFKGNVKDFAMVVPVPVVLQREDIKVVSNSLFTKLDAYSAPRIVEYYDDNPCMEYKEVLDNVVLKNETMAVVEDEATEADEAEYHVKIEAKYSVEEYDVLILSAKESNGLKRWLTDNGYSIPSKAEEVLDPYIKNNLKFFVVKVNLEKQQLMGGYLRPLQIRFEHERFMLPIRLGMANANGEQDLLVYAFSKSGRIETANYRTVKVPSNRNIPLFVQNRFDRFYKDMFEKTYKSEGRNAVFLEYAWDLSPRNYVKCDPCVGEVPNYGDMATAGVDWLNTMGNSINQQANVYFTRLHVRYSRDKFPQDLMLMETRNTENFQGRYIITHPAEGGFSCSAGQDYLYDLKLRRSREMQELAALTGWNTSKYAYYPEEYNDLIKKKESPKEDKAPPVDDTTPPQEEENTILPSSYTPNDSGGTGSNGGQWNVLFYLSMALFVLLSAFHLKLMWQNRRKTIHG